MKTSNVYRQNEADYSVIAELQQRLEKLLDNLDEGASDYAKAKQIVEFNGDRKKSALGEAFTAILATDPEVSATAAEHRARASTGYKQRMGELQKEYMAAENAITLHDLLRTRLEVARSLLAVERAKLERL